MTVKCGCKDEKCDIALCFDAPRESTVFMSVTGTVAGESQAISVCFGPSELVRLIQETKAVLIEMTEQGA